MLGLARFVTHGSAGSGPSLNYNFVDGGAFPSAITFSRGSNATQFDSSGNLVYAPANLLTYSEQFDNAIWGPVAGTVTANATTAPSGAVTADRGVTSGVNFQVIQGATITSGATVSGSVFLKADGINEVELVLLASNNTTPYGRATFNVSTGVISTAASSANGGTNVSASITAINNGWYRCVVTVTYPATTSAGMRIYAQGATGGIFLWGAQLNPTPVLGGVTGSLSTYYPTTASAYYGPRLDYDPVTLAAQGLLIEEQRTNSIRNNTMQGAVAGTPGTQPTNWSIQSPNAGLTREIVGVGTQNGITYIDVRFSGTTTGTAANLVFFELNSAVAASNGQTWTGTAWIALVGGSFANINIMNLTQRFNDAGGVSLTISGTSILSATSLMNRYSITSTASNASTAFVTNLINASFSVGVAIDITLRIGLPQLELGAFATSVIPTTTTALTRSADVASVNTLAPWFNATEGTLFVDASNAQGTAPSLFSTDDGTTSNRIITFANAANSPTFRIVSGGVDQASFSAGTISFGAAFKLAAAYKANDFAASLNGAAVVTDTSGNVPAGQTTARLGLNVANAAHINGYLRRVSYYPVRLTNAALQQITT